MSKEEKILVVDDEPDVEWLFRQRFRREIRAGQFGFAFVLSGEEALGYLRRGGAADIVLVLSDINMPGMTGLDLLQAVKDEYPALKVMMITAYGDDRNYRAAMTYGADDYFTKPLDFTTLKEKMVLC